MRRNNQLTLPSYRFDNKMYLVPERVPYSLHPFARATNTVLPPLTACYVVLLVWALYVLKELSGFSKPKIDSATRRFPAEA